MRVRAASRLAWVPMVFFLGLAVVGLALAVANGREGDFVENLAFALIFLAFAIVGVLIASRRPENVIGWMFTGIAGGAALAFVADQYAIYALRVSPRSVPAGEWAAWVTSWSWLMFITPVFTYLPLLFPDGRAPSLRWKRFAWVMSAFVLFALMTFALAPEIDMGDEPSVRNPMPLTLPQGLVDVAEGPGFAVFLLFGLGSAVSLFLRYRRSRTEERQQIRWFVYSVGFVAAFFVLTAVLETIGGTELSENWVTTVLAVLAFGSVPVTAGIGILKHRLYDIDVVINKTVVLGALAVFITAVYVAIVVGIGAAVGSRSNLGLSILATAIIAVAFQPVRERARHLANRLVYGKRATPYEVLSEFSERMAGTYASEDVLPRMARILAEGTGAGRAEVWLRVGEEIRPAASWPPDDHEVPPSPPMPLVDGALPPFPAASIAADVAHQGELLGALAVTKPPAEPLTSTEEKLVSDLASQAGLVLRTVRLTTELMARLEDLRASRKRLVTAQDEERRRLERNIHDGAQQQLVSLAVKLRILEALVPRDPEQALAVVRELQAEANAALDDLRDLARGIYPPLLADRGLVPALEAQARKAVGHVRVQATGGSPVGAPDGAVGRYPQEVEAAVYFCVLEALQNVTKYARATEAVVSLEAADGELTFTVADDGVGFDPKAAVGGSGLRNMADRVAALGGTLDVRSVPGRGTTVTGSIPIG